MKKNFLLEEYYPKSPTFKQIFRAMRITTFLLWTCVLCSYASDLHSQNARVNLNMTNTRIETVLNEIENQTDYLFVYNNQINVDRKVSVKESNSAVSNVLGKLLANTDIHYVMEGSHIILSKNNAVVQQTKRITGVVVDNNGEPIIGANVSVKGTSTGTITDVSGKFSLQTEPGGTLIISYLGYLTKEISIDGKSSVDIVLVEDTKTLDEVVVIGYGTQRKGSVATSITTVKAEALQNRPVQTVGEALQGQVPGLSIVANAQPGKAPSIRLRGVTSLNDKDDSGSPLVLVDGVPSDFNYLNPEDIESINVLKDAASAAIYGSRAANGVLLITTKRGKAGKPIFRYNGSVGINTPTFMPQMCSSAVYARALNEAEGNMGRSPVYLPDVIAKFEDGSDPNRYPNTDWLSLAVQNSLSTRHNIEASGGNETVKYLISGGFDHQTGVFPRSQQNIFNVRSNTDIAVSKRFNISLDMRYQLRKVDNGAGVENTYENLLFVDPTKVAYYTDGTYGYNPGFYINPLVDLYESGNNLYDRHDISGIFKFDYTIIDGLKFTGIANVNYVFGNTTNTSRMKKYKEFFSQQEFPAGSNNLTEKREHTGYYNLQALLTYQKKFGKHNFDVLAGYQQESQNSNWITAGRTGFPTDLIWQLTAGPKDNWSNDGNGEHWAIASVIGRLNYDYDNRYMISASFRSDASSRFASENRWATFPSVAAAWRISQESFMESTKDWLDDLKIRASWGQNGSSTGLGLYPSYTTIAMDGVVLNGTWLQTAKLDAVGNKNLGWERTEMVNIGVDFTILQNRLSFTGEYYIKTTKDILIGLPVPLEYGFGKPNVNIGKMRNSGWEMELRWNDKVGKVNYGASFNISDNRNKVLDLAGTGPWKDGYTDEGLPFRSIYGYESLGLFQTDEEVANAPFQNNKTSKGDVRYKNQNGDNKIDANDRVVLGDPNPHFLYGVNLNAEYKGFDISAFFQGIGQKDMIMNDYSVRPLSNSPIFEHQLDYWNANNTGAKYPRLLNKEDGAHNYETSDFWMINSGYFRMKNLQIGYTIPKKVLASSGFSRVRVYVSASNLFTISDFVPGWDPEVSKAVAYPFARTYSLGLNVQF